MEESQVCGQTLDSVVVSSLRECTCQIRYTMQLVKPILAGAVRSFAVREEASAKYNSWMQQRLVRTVWNFCNSYYRRESTNGKNFATFPGPVTLFWWLTQSPRYSDYDIVGGERWRRVRKVKGILRAALVVVAIAVVGCAGRGVERAAERAIQMLLL
jgi:hypothetical protein